MKTLVSLIFLNALLVVSAGCTTASEADAVTQAAAAPLLETQWRVTQVGDVAVPNPSGTRAVHFSLQAQGQNVTGFAGCNRMFGRYVLDGATLKFDALGSTKMFCDVRMELEQRFLAMFSSVTQWKMSGPTLELLNADGKAVATFSAEPASP